MTDFTLMSNEAATSILSIYKYKITTPQRISDGESLVVSGNELVHENVNDGNWTVETNKVFHEDVTVEGVATIPLDYNHTNADYIYPSTRIRRHFYLNQIVTFPDGQFSVSHTFDYSSYGLVTKPIIIANGIFYDDFVTNNTNVVVAYNITTTSCTVRIIRSTNSTPERNVQLQVEVIELVT